MDGETDTPGGAAPTGDVPINPTDIVPQGIGPLVNVPPIAGFWRRMAGFVIDLVVLGIVGQLVGLSMSSILFQLGPYGRIAGLAVALLYFGLMDAGVAGGQTPGKRLMRVAVRTAEGRPIRVGRSMLRTLIWLVPATVNGWALPVMEVPVVGVVSSIVLFGVGGAVVVTMVFNRRSRQGFHDMLTHTFVLDLDGRPIDALPKATSRQWILPGAILVGAALLTIVASVLGSRLGTPVAQLTGLQQTLRHDDRFFSVGVFDQTFRLIGGNATRTLAIQVWYKGVPTESERASVVGDVARAALQVEDVGRYDLIRIQVTSAYDLGIATWHVTSADGEPVSTWRERVGEGPAQPH